MAKTSMKIVMSEDLKRRVHEVAEKSGKSVQEFAQEALYTYVEDIEDGAICDVALAEEGLDYLLPEGGPSVGVDRPVFAASRKTA